MSRRNRQKLFSQRGVALIAVAGALSMLAIVSQEFTVDTDVDYEAAKNNADEMRAHFLARSGMNLGKIVIKVQTDVLDRYRQYIGDIQLADYLPMFIGAFGGSPDEVQALGAMIGAGSATRDLDGLGVIELVPEDEREQIDHNTVMGFDVVVTTEDGKINLNCAGNNSQVVRDAIQTQLAAMFFPEAYDDLFQNEDAEGWRRDRETQVAAILDYIDRDGARHGADGTPEEYGYESLDDDYEPKNNYVDTVGEIKLVRGIDDRMWTLFGSAFTVYGNCKVNVAAAQDVNLIAAIIAVTAKDPDDPVLRDSQKLWALAQYVANARNLGIMFDQLDSFAEFVKQPGGALGDLFGTDAEAGGQALADNPMIPDGVELDAQKLQQIAEAGPRQTYRVEATARLNKVEKRIVGVWDKNVQRQNDRKPGRGAWVFWREE